MIRQNSGTGRPEPELIRPKPVINGQGFRIVRTDIISTGQHCTIGIPIIDYKFFSFHGNKFPISLVFRLMYWVFEGYELLVALILR
jgi:hypothetical protein